MKIGDFVITGIILAAAYFVTVPFMGDADSTLTAVVMQKAQVIKTIDLSSLREPLEFEVGGKYQNTIRAEPGRIRVIEATCPDDICVHTGWLTKAGQAAACLPNELLVKVEGAGSEVDTYLR